MSKKELNKSITKVWMLMYLYQARNLRIPKIPHKPILWIASIPRDQKSGPPQSYL